MTTRAGTTMKAIRVARTGGPEVLRLEEVPRPEPGRGEALVRIEAAGVNYIDVYHRTGLYPKELPFVPGLEAAGTVEAVGAKATGLRKGARVAWGTVPGAYAEYAVVPADRLVRLPSGVGTKDGAALMLQGMTAHYLACSVRPLKKGDTCLVHAAAGGVGLLLCQIARLRGARVIGTVSTEAKAERARAAGASDIILYTRQAIAAEVKKLTGGRGVQVAYDGVGRATWEASIDALAPRGMLALFGQSSGPVPPFDAQLLSRKGSLFLTRPTLFHYTANRAELLQRADDLFTWVADGRLTISIDSEHPLADAAAAHRRLESRATSGKLLLLP